MSPAVHIVDECVQSETQSNSFSVDNRGFVDNPFISTPTLPLVTSIAHLDVDRSGDGGVPLYTMAPLFVYSSDVHISTAPITTSIIFYINL
jgi:hypothetical protein